jgi:hypothetical protein
MDRAISSQPAMDFVRLLIDDVVPTMNKLGSYYYGEVKLSSATFSIGERLVVLMGGRAHL